MQNEWIPFLEAIHRMNSRLIMADFTAKPLLRSAVASGRVSGRGEYRERGNIIFVLLGESLENEPNVIREGSHFYRAEIYPGEVLLSELRSWIENLAQDDPILSFRSPMTQSPIVSGATLLGEPDARRQSELDTRSRSGAPGRPTSMHLVKEQFRLRMSNGSAEATNTAESRVLSRWLSENHPSEPQLQPKAIRNRLGEWRRKIEAARN